MESDDIEQTVLLDYYIGEQGPTIRIDIPSEHTLAKIREIFEKLTKDAKGSFQFHSLGFVRCLNAIQLNASTNTELPKSFEMKTLRRVRREQPVFSWQRTPEGWGECLERLHSICGPGHQYLTIEGTDDALVEASFAESDPALRMRLLRASRMGS